MMMIGSWNVGYSCCAQARRWMDDGWSQDVAWPLCLSPCDPVVLWDRRCCHFGRFGWVVWRTGGNCIRHVRRIVDDTYGLVRPESESILCLKFFLKMCLDRGRLFNFPENPKTSECMFRFAS